MLLFAALKAGLISSTRRHTTHLIPPRQLTLLTLTSTHTSLLPPPNPHPFQQRSLTYKTKAGTGNSFPELAINNKIKADTVVLIDENGKNIGQMRLYDALRAARSKNLDLLCVSPQAVPPICKIYSYGKYKYENRGKSKVVSPKVKEIRFGDKIEEHDVTNKMNMASKFLLQMITVRITITCGRDYDSALAEAMVENLYSRVAHFAKREPSITVNNRWEKVEKLKANPDLTPEDMANDAAARAARKAEKEAKASNQSTESKKDGLEGVNNTASDTNNTASNTPQTLPVTPTLQQHSNNTTSSTNTANTSNSNTDNTASDTASDNNTASDSNNSNSPTTQNSPINTPHKV